MAENTILKDKIKLSGLSISELSRRTGLSRTMLYRFINGTSISKKSSIKLAEVLNILAEELNPENKLKMPSLKKTKKLLEDVNISKLARTSGMSRTIIYKKLNGKNVFTPEDIKKFANALGINESKFY